ncbi:hypothetical protein UCDDA912_g05006 [Diaporthe ampelina]|uniref:Uncharacterized protein n=1 Tax=Diaporthe ampelina TaxID=1214573 RepID=A0A0G2FLY8_9PEZI|nr:hypothetical protein UCDDA912_g05006 [Diaporthe ampelina]
MKLEDLFDSQNKYDPFNKWNGVMTHDNGNTLTTVNPGCIVHLAQINNTLSAEVDIAAQATVIRKDAQGNIVKDATKLCNCSGYGDAERNSDPTIGIAINNLARNGVSVSIANPVALYMNSFQTANFMLDADGTGNNLQPVPDKTFTWVRGDVNKAMGLRLHIQIPEGVKGTGDNEGRQLTVSDLVDTSNGQNILYGAQFADYISMGVAGVGISGGTAAAAQYCPGKGPQSNSNENGSIHANGFAASAPPVWPRRVVAGEHSIVFQTRGRH